MSKGGILHPSVTSPKFLLNQLHLPDAATICDKLISVLSNEVSGQKLVFGM